MLLGEEKDGIRIFSPSQTVSSTRSNSKANYLFNHPGCSGIPFLRTNVLVSKGTKIFDKSQG
jgi:hypothetical protein